MPLKNSSKRRSYAAPFKHCLMLAAVMCTATSVNAAPIVAIVTGKVRGMTQADVAAFKGIPFAQAPVGDLRWRAPQAMKSWSGVRKAVEYGPDCMQISLPGDAAPLGVPPREDCLYLNVWKPDKAGSKKLPVMVWIYGGGFVNGGSSPSVYDGSAFAKRGVVLVSFNYRIGYFGFFAHPALSAESKGMPTGNFAFLDQIAALQWVKRNIKAFGGDPDNVTVFGESAGGMSVHALMTSPLARGLFQRAIVESGAGRSGIKPLLPLHDAAMSAEQVGVEYATSLGITDTGAAGLAALRKLPAETVMAGLNMASMEAKTFSGPMIDGEVLTQDPADAYAKGATAKVPLMIGANSGDGFFFGGTLDQVLARYGTEREHALALLDPDRSGDVRLIGLRAEGDRVMIEPARFVARAQTVQGQPVYAFRFSYVAESMRKEWNFGAPHASEIPYVFNTLAARYGNDVHATDAAIANTVQQYWINFARTGNPNGDGLPKWPVYNAQTDAIMDFSAQGTATATADPLRGRLDLAERLAAGEK